MEETIMKLKEEEKRLQAMLSSKMEEKAKQEKDLGRTNEEIEKAQEIIRSQEQLRETREKEKEKIESDIERIQEVVKEMERKKASLERQEEIKKRRKALQEKKTEEAKELKKNLVELRKKEKEIEDRLNKLESDYQISIESLAIEEKKPEEKADPIAMRDEKLRTETMAYFHNQKDGEYVDWKEIEEAKRSDNKRTPKKITPENGDNGGTNNTSTKKESKIKSFASKIMKKAGVLKENFEKISDTIMKFLKLKDDDDIFEEAITLENEPEVVEKKEDIGDPILAGQVQGIMEEERKDQAYNLRQLLKESEEQNLAKRRKKEPALEAMHKRREIKRNTAPLPNLKAEEQKKSWELPNGEKLKVVKGTNQVSEKAANEMVNEALKVHDKDSRYPIANRRTGGRELVEE